MYTEPIAPSPSFKHPVIVTGGTGFIGQHVITELLKQGNEVIAAVRNLEKAETMTWFGKARIVTFDIGAAIPTFEIPGNSVLLHCAWENVRDQ